MAGDIDINNLFPAIVESFVIILIGYLFGRFRIVEPTEARSISTLVGKLALPALIARNLIDLDLSTVSWQFLASILLAKLAIFILVTTISFVATRPWNIGRAGLYGIFATQSNDFALGLPIVQALYGATPQPGEFFYASYLYLLTPVSLVCINPIGFFMLEYSKQKSRSSTRSRLYQTLILILKTVRGVCFNPLVFMTFLSVLVNAIVTYGIRKKLPDWLLQFLEILGGAYASCALFCIGIFMVGRIKSVSGKTLLVGGLLIVAKSLILPMIGYITVGGVVTSDVMNTTNEKLSAFGFLYCTFPTAPTVFIYASQYNTAMTIIASSLVFGTLLSAPIMYVSARMVLIQFASQDDYSSVIVNSKMDVSIVAMACLVWVFALFIIARRFRSLLYVIVMHMMVAMFIECLFGILLDVVDKLTYWSFLIFSLFFVGVFATRLWLAWLAVTLLIFTIRGPATAEKVWFPMLISSWGIPMLLTAVMVLSSPSGLLSPSISHVDKSFEFGSFQLVVSLLFLCTGFIVGTLSVLTLLFKRGVKLRGRHPGRSNTNTLVPVHPRRFGATSNDTMINEERSPERDNKTDHSHEHSPNRDTEITASSQSVTSAESHMQVLGPLPGVDSLHKDEHGLTRFVVLLVFLLFSCLVGILTVFWKLVNKKIDGIFIAVNILDTVTNFGQGFFVFLVFGFEKYWFWTALYQKLRKCFLKIETVTVPVESELSAATVNLCNTFKMQYLELCKEDIVSDKRYLFRVYPSVFCGSDLVDWLIEKRLAHTREDAVEYGQNLLEGGLLAHVMEEHNFYDESYFYKFLR